MQRSALNLFWLASLASTLCSPAFAGGTMFRCGSSYQDRPCDAGQPSKVINSSGVARDQAPVVSAPPSNSTAATTAAPVAAVKVDAECAALGNRAKQVVWAKESGRTAEVQLAAAKSDAERRLIADVFNRRGSSLDIRQGVETDCMADKERAAQAAALIEAAAKLQGQGRSALPAAQAEQARPFDPAAPRQATAPNPDLAAKNARCQATKGQLDEITSAQRAGGNMARMDQLNLQRQAAAKAWRDAGC